jgi:multiple sugar transport system ATP-binding protein
MNLLPARLADGALHAAGAVLPRPGGLSDDDEVVYGVRPEYMDLSRKPRPDAFPGAVSVLENLGTSTLVTLESEQAIVQLVVPEGEEPPLGAEAWAVPRRALVYRNGDLLPGLPPG